MLNYLKTRIIESDQPVGGKRITNWKLPPKEFSYGFSGQLDEEGVSITSVTRSWLIHQPSRTAQPPQDFVRINKLAVKMNAVNYSSNKDFRENIDIKQKIKKGSKVRHIKLPPRGFSYGRRSGTPDPVKEIINNEFGNRAEKEIKQEYSNFMKRKNQSRSMPKNNKQIERLIQLRRKEETIHDKPLYKHTMFRNIGSKITENLKSFKTYHERSKSDLDKIIDHVQKQIQTNENK